MVTSPTPAAARVLRRLDALADLQRGPRGGADRAGFSADEQAAHDLVADWMREAGLEVTVEGAGTLLGRLPGSDPAAGEVWSGSHLDTVPDGGRFDGALGVVGALEAIASLAAERHRATLAVVAFRDEEGWRFGRGLTGSRALCGRLGADELQVVDADGVPLGVALAALGLDPPPAAGWLAPGRPAAYVELHVEQGPRLAAAGRTIAAVDGVVGLVGLRATFEGGRGHAGTTPMDDRADALRSAARLVLAVADAARAEPGAVGTVGDVRLGLPRLQHRAGRGDRARRPARAGRRGAAAGARRRSRPRCRWRPPPRAAPRRSSCATTSRRCGSTSASSAAIERRRQRDHGSTGAAHDLGRRPRRGRARRRRRADRDAVRAQPGRRRQPRTGGGDRRRGHRRRRCARSPRTLARLADGEPLDA